MPHEIKVKVKSGPGMPCTNVEPWRKTGVHAGETVTFRNLGDIAVEVSVTHRSPVFEEVGNDVLFGVPAKDSTARTVRMDVKPGTVRINTAPVSCTRQEDSPKMEIEGH